MSNQQVLTYFLILTLETVFLWTQDFSLSLLLKPLNTLGIASFHVVAFLIFNFSLLVSRILSSSPPSVMVQVKHLLVRIAHHCAFTPRPAPFCTIDQNQFFPKWMIRGFLTWFGYNQIHIIIFVKNCSMISGLKLSTNFFSFLNIFSHVVGKKIMKAGHS